jgi:anti-anti-sigma regulatory factor
MLDTLRRIGRKPETIILRMDSVPYIDSSGASALEAFIRQAKSEGTRLLLCDLREQPSVFLAKMHPAFLGAEPVPTFQAALDRLSPRSAIRS